MYHCLVEANNCNAWLPVGRLNAMSSPCFIAQDANALLCSSHFMPCLSLSHHYLRLGPQIHDLKFQSWRLENMPWPHRIGVDVRLRVWVE